MILRHQLAVLQRQPRHRKLNWADRALLAALLGVIPRLRRYGLRLLVTPDTIVRWHRDIVRRRWAARSMRGKTGITRHPTGQGATQLARNLADELAEAGCRLTYLVRDRDAKFTAAFDAVFASTGITTLPIAPQAPTMNAYAERFVRTARAGCTDRMLIAGEQHLHAVLSEYIGHYNTGRSHQGHGMGLRAPDDAPDVIAFPGPIARIQRRTRLAGLINEYRQAA